MNLSQKIIQLVIIIFASAYSVFAQSDINLEFEFSDTNVIQLSANAIDNTGKTLVSDAINQAIEKVANHPQKNTLVIPKGIYLVGSIYMKSNVRLHLSEGAILLGSTNMEDYSSESPECTSAQRGILVIKNCSNVVINGAGVIDGNWDCGSKHNLLFNNADHVTIQGIKSIHHTGWNSHVYRSHHILYDGVTIKTHPESGNIDDGIDIVSCHDVEIRHCDIRVVDDGIVVKNKEISREPIDVYNIHIHDNVVSSKYVAALKIGTETTPGNWKNILFENNRCLEGNLKVIIWDGIILKDVSFLGNDFYYSRDRHSENFDIHIEVGDRKFGCLGKGPGSGTIQNVTIKDCRFYNPKDSESTLIEGLNENNKINSVRFENVFMGNKLVTCREDLHLFPEKFVDKIEFADAGKGDVFLRKVGDAVK